MTFFGSFSKFSPDASAKVIRHESRLDKASHPNLINYRSLCRTATKRDQKRSTRPVMVTPTPQSGHNMSAPGSARG